MQRPIVIAHRGASGYLPEHTLEAKALAFGMRADYLEQDVVATRDDRLVVLHDLWLDRVSDVAARFPDRQRVDGRWYVRDFDLEELLTLALHERREAGGGAAWPGRFPVDAGRFRIVPLEDELAMIRGLAASTGRTAGVYPEIKDPGWHRGQGVDLAALVVDALAREGWTRRDDPVFLQCFDAAELRRVRQELGCDLKLVQLLPATGPSPPDATTAGGLAEIREYADGIGPSLEMLYELAEIDGHPVSTGLARRARKEGLVVHPYTFRADDLPRGFASFEDLVRWCAETLGIDGLFTDFPDLARAALSLRT